MSRDKIKKDYSKKIRLFEKYNLHYYDKSKPLITDEEFDNFKKEIINLEKNYSFLSNLKSPSNSVGFYPSKMKWSSSAFEKLEHGILRIRLYTVF